MGWRGGGVPTVRPSAQVWCPDGVHHHAPRLTSAVGPNERFHAPCGTGGMCPCGSAHQGDSVPWLPRHSRGVSRLQTGESGSNLPRTMCEDGAYRDSPVGEPHCLLPSVRSTAAGRAPRAARSLAKRTAASVSPCKCLSRFVPPRLRASSNWGFSSQIPACLCFLGRMCRQSEEIHFVDARKLGRMVDRTHSELTDGNIARIAGASHA